MSRTVALVGGGVIGASWAAVMLAAGPDVVARVVVTDPGPEAEERMRRDVDRAAPAMVALGHDVTGWTDRLAFAGSVAEAVDGVDWVQENTPEREDVKAEVLADVDRHAPADAVVASSSSTLMPSVLAAMCPDHPERVVVGHPFNPVHLVPLVEVVGGPGTDPDVVRRAVDFYAALGKRPIHLQREIRGHVANRLQAALWREAYSLVESGVASVADVDAAIAHGPGLRWALLGPLVNQHLSGGEAGLAHVLAHLGPPTQLIMDELGEPQLTPALVELLVSGTDAELEGVDQVAMAAARDELLLGLLAAKAKQAALPR